MKKKYLGLFLTVFIMFFCFNIEVVVGATVADAGTGTGYSYGVKCIYGGERISKIIGNGSTGGITNGQIYPYTYSLKVNCNNTSCDKLSISTYGLVKGLDGKKQEIRISNSNQLNTMVNSNSSLFGFVKGKGLSKCPDKVGFEQENVAANGSNVEQFGRFLLNQNYTQASLEKQQKFSSSEARKIDIKSDTDESISNKTRKSYSSGANGDTSNTTTKENKKQNGSNTDNVKYIVDGSKVNNSTYQYGEITCTELLGDQNVELIRNIMFVFSAFAIVLVIILGITDFIKAIASSDDDAIMKAVKKLKIRIISVVILLLIPVLVNFILNFVNGNLRFEIIDSEGNATDKEVSIKVGNVSDCGQ